MIFTANIMICSESREQVYDGERRNESQVVQGGDKRGKDEVVRTCAEEG